MQVCLYAHLSVCLSVFIFAFCLSVCLSMNLSVCAQLCCYICASLVTFRTATQHVTYLSDPRSCHTGVRVGVACAPCVSTPSYAELHVTVSGPITVACRSWSYDKTYCWELDIFTVQYEHCSNNNIRVHFRSN